MPETGAANYPRRNFIVGAFGLGIPVVLAVVGWIWFNGSTDRDPVTSGAPPTSATPTPPTLTPTPTPTPTPPALVYLADLEAVGYDDPFGPDPQTINGETYPRAVSASSGGCARNQETEYQWVLGGDYSTFTAVIGLNDDTTEEPRVQIEVELDGSVEYSEEFSAGDRNPVKISTSGANRITLRQIYLGPSPGICSENATAVWGDAAVTE